MSDISVYGLTVNYLSAPVGVDSLPRFSYKIKSDVRGDRQVSRRIRVFSDAEHTATVWDEGEQPTENQLFVPYDGEPLVPVRKYYYSVTVKTAGGGEATAESSFVTGKLDERWTGKWITAQYVRRENDAFGAVYIRKAFEKHMKGEGFCLVELLSPCPTNLNLTPVKSVERIKNEMIKYFPLGEFKDKKEEA